MKLKVKEIVWGIEICMYKEIESAGELTSNGIDFIKEDDACFLCARHLKQLPHHPCSLDTGRSHITVHISHITDHISQSTYHSPQFKYT